MGVPRLMGVPHAKLNKARGSEGKEGGGPIIFGTKPRYYQDVTSMNDKVCV